MGIYLAYFARFIQARLSYKWDLIAELVATLVVTVTGLLFIVLLLDGETITNLRGWTREEILFIYGYSLLPTALFNVIGPNLYQFGDKYVIQGQYDRVLLRPLNGTLQVLFESFNLESVANFAVGLAVVSYASLQLGLSFGFLDLVWLLVSSISGAVILLSVFVILASASFHFEDRLGIAPPFYNLIMFGRYPLPIFNHLVQFILTWVVPFAFAAFYPATHFIGRSEFRVLCYASPLMAVASATVAAACWRWGESRYSSTGN